jgi:hypothetical protein
MLIQQKNFLVSGKSTLNPKHKSETDKKYVLNLLDWNVGYGLILELCKKRYPNTSIQTEKHVYELHKFGFTF